MNSGSAGRTLWLTLSATAVGFSAASILYEERERAALLTDVAPEEVRTLGQLQLDRELSMDVRALRADLARRDSIVRDTSSTGGFPNGTLGVLGFVAASDSMRAAGLGAIAQNLVAKNYLRVMEEALGAQTGLFRACFLVTDQCRRAWDRWRFVSEKESAAYEHYQGTGSERRDEVQDFVVGVHCGDRVGKWGDREYGQAIPRSSEWQGRPSGRTAAPVGQPAPCSATFSERWVNHGSVVLCHR